MVGVEKRGAEIRQFILKHVQAHPRDIVALTAQAFHISRQGVHRHLQRLRRDQALCVHGTTRNRRYTLQPRTQWAKDYVLSEIAGEDVIWRRDIRPVLGALPANVLDIWQYGFTEMLNNALEHSAGQRVVVSVIQTAIDTQMAIGDDGEGIFKKLQRELGLADERHAVLELGKGKVTTDPVHHTGEGIFFTSRMFGHFLIFSGNVSFAHRRAEEFADDPLDWIGQEERATEGTVVGMTLKNTVPWTTKEVFDQFSTDRDYGFTKTVVPVHLAQYGDEKLVSRSQAKRLLAGMTRFKVVLLDFAGVESIGQAFADEVFRVFVEAHPQIELSAGHTNTTVQQMLRHVAGTRAEDLLADEETYMTTHADLYDRDFYAWTQTQAALLRKGAVQDLDLEHLLEEMEDMGHSQRDALASHLLVLLTHLLKLAIAARKRPADLARAGRGWRTTCRTQRRLLAKRLRRNPSLRPTVPEECAEAYVIARDEAATALDVAEDVVPVKCPWTPEQILDEDFWPEGEE